MSVLIHYTTHQGRRRIKQIHRNNTQDSTLATLRLSIKKVNEKLELPDRKNNWLARKVVTSPHLGLNHKKDFIES